MTKNIGRNFVFFSRGILGRKLPRQVALPISGKNTQMSLAGTKPTYNEKGKKQKNRFVRLQAPALFSFFLSGSIVGHCDKVSFLFFCSIHNCTQTTVRV